MLQSSLEKSCGAAPSETRGGAVTQALAVSRRVEEKKKKGGEVGVGSSSPFRPSPPAWTQAELVGPPSQHTHPSGPLTLSTFFFLTLTWHVGPAHQ